MLKNTPIRRACMSFIIALLASSCAQNNTPHSNPSDTDVPPPEQIQEQEQGKSRVSEAKTEHSRIEDDNAQIDEVRVRGQTQSIEVKPQNNMPAYEVAPYDPARPDDDTAGRSRWRILSF